MLRDLLVILFILSSPIISRNRNLIRIKNVTAPEEPAKQQTKSTLSLTNLSSQTDAKYPEVWFKDEHSKKPTYLVKDNKVNESLHPPVETNNNSCAFSAQFVDTDKYKTRKFYYSYKHSNNLIEAGKTTEFKSATLMTANEAIIRPTITNEEKSMDSKSNVVGSFDLNYMCQNTKNKEVFGN